MVVFDLLADHRTKNSRPSKNTQDNHKKQTKQNYKANTRSSRTPKLKQTVNSRNLELFRCSYIRKAEDHYNEHQIPSSQEPVHLMMAG
jgi:hypothetical protein